eukprot:6920595-Alexandrium_andersonii.AAC.1
MQDRFGRSDLELHSPSIGPRSSRGVRSVPLFAQVPSLQTEETGIMGVPAAANAPASVPGAPE